MLSCVFIPAPEFSFPTVPLTDLQRAVALLSRESTARNIALEHCAG